VVYGLIQARNEFLKILFVQEDFVLLKMLVPLITGAGALTFGNGHEKVVATGGLYVKEVRALACAHCCGMHIIAVVISFTHKE
jgi:hypothetical protein